MMTQKIEAAGAGRLYIPYIVYSNYIARGCRLYLIKAFLS